MPTKEGPQVAFPGTAAVVDGSEAIASVETRISEIACAYPISLGGRVVDANLDLVAAAYDGVLDVTAAVKAMVPAPRHQLTVVEVAR